MDILLKTKIYTERRLFTCSSTSSLMAQVNSQKCGKFTKIYYYTYKICIYMEKVILFMK